MLQLKRLCLRLLLGLKPSIKRYRYLRLKKLVLLLLLLVLLLLLLLVVLIMELQLFAVVGNDEDIVTSWNYLSGINVMAGLCCFRLYAL